MQADFFEQRRRPIATIDARAADVVDQHRFGERGFDRHPRIERAVRILKHDLHLLPQLAQVAAADGPQVDAVVEHLAARRFDQPQNRPAGRRLAAARFADEAQRLARIDVEANAVDRLHVVDHTGQDAAANWKIDFEILDVQQRPSPFVDRLRIRSEPALLPRVAHRRQCRSSDAAVARGLARPAV